MRLPEIYDPWVLGFSDKEQYKKPGTELPQTARISGNAVDVHTLTQEKNPKPTSELKKQLKKVDATSVARLFISQRLVPKMLLFWWKQKLRG